MADDLPIPQIQQPNDGGLDVGQPAEMLQRSTRIRRPPARFDDYVMLTDCGEPSCYKEALQREDKAQWELAMKLEMDSLKKNQTWDLVQLPIDKTALSL